MRKLLLVILALCVMQGVAMPQPNPDAIPAYILINVDAFDPEDPMTDDVGYPLQAFDMWQLMGKQVPPNWVQLTLTDTDVKTAQAYCAAWLREVDYDVVAHDPVLDGYRMRVFVKPELVSASGLNALTRERVENYLNNWGASVVNVAQNQVTFDARIRDAIWSNGFWGVNVSVVDFTEQDYDSGTGVHTTYVNAENLLTVSRDRIAGIIINRCGISSIISAHPNKKQFTFECGRDTVAQAFKRDVKERVDGLYTDRKWYIIKQFIDLAYANGGNIDLTQQEAIQYLHNRLLD